MRYTTAVVLMCGIVAGGVFVETAEAKRMAPKPVQPVVHNGIRYVAVHWGHRAGKRQNGGHVQAWDVKTNTCLWTRQAYTIRYRPGLERDVQDVFITSMKVVGDKLAVTDERGKTFTLELAEARQPARGAATDKTVADEAQRSPRETFVAYFQAMEARQQGVAKALKAPECSDHLHMNIHNLNIVDRLKPFYELSTANRALVVAHPFTTSAVRGRDEVIYAELLKLGGTWRIQTLSRTSPENASWLMKGFQVHPDVNLDLSTEALVGEWRYPCDSNIILKADGTGSDFEVGPAGPLSGQKPEQFTWDVSGSTLNLRFADREAKLIVTSIDHGHVSFRNPNKKYWGSWRRKTPAEQTGAGQPATASEEKADDREKPKPESEGRSQ